MTLPIAALVALALLAPPKDGPRVNKEAKKVTKKTTTKAKKELACDASIEAIAVSLDEGLELLTKESKDKDNGSAERGVAAFQAWAKTAGPVIAKHRAEATDLEKSLSEADKKECDERAYKRLYKSLTRLVNLGVFYRGQRAVYRTLGDLFR